MKAKLPEAKLERSPEKRPSPLSEASEERSTKRTRMDGEEGPASPGEGAAAAVGTAQGGAADTPAGAANAGGANAAMWAILTGAGKATEGPEVREQVS